MSQRPAERSLTVLTRDLRSEDHVDARQRAGARTAIGSARSAAALAAVCVLGLMKVRYPLGVDQAVFGTYARMMAEGSVLYDDIWDPKQPGVFYFYLLAGYLFGFSQEGSNVLLLLLLLFGGGIGAAHLRASPQAGKYAWMFPVLAVGYFYLLANIRILGQVEAIVGPLLLAYYLVAIPSPGRMSTRRLFAAGIIAGAVGWFKLILLPIPAAIAVTAGVLSAREGGRGPKHTVRYLLPQLVGSLVPLGALLVWAFANGVAGELWFTYVEFPFSFEQFRPEAGEAATRFRLFGFRAFTILAPLLLLGLFTVRRALRDRQRLVPVAMTVAWLAAATLVVLLQSWHPYHTSLWFFPAALLATEGLAALSERENRRSSVLVAVLALLSAVPGLYLLTSPYVRAEVQHAAGHFGREEEFLSELGVSDTLEALSAVDLAEDETIATFGAEAPLVYLSGRHQGVRLQPWHAQYLLEQAVAEVEDMHPDWVFLPHRYVRWEGEPVPDELRRVLTEDYELEASIDAGEWYRRR
jgi:hypothetical protein